MARQQPTRLLTHPGLLALVYAIVRIGAPLAVVFGLMYETWTPVLSWIGIGCGTEALLWLDRTYGLRPARRKLGPR